MTVSVKSEAARDADRLLEKVWWRSTPGAGVPVDPVQIARRLGIDVLTVWLESTMGGALVKEPGQDPSILLNSMDSSNRQRFTCAHEIGHFVRRSEQPDKYEYVDYRDQLSGQGTSQEEVYANNFAACLLMPEDVVRELHTEGNSDVELAWYFDVSREAMQYRLKNLGLL